MMLTPQEVLKKNTIYAVVGATQNTAKYGYEILRILIDYGYKTYPVNSKYASIDGEPCYKSLSDLPEKPEVVVSVVPPEVTETLIDECHRLGIATVWMPPGAESGAALKKCEDCGLEYVYDACVILAVKLLGKRSA